ncbi:hypothetical protein NDU88_004264 [Pleurodeles waltl]|uniref:Uncharacterized protein n=1 Tax=Pleurodeles waltl TaxID=8319 RepID=A0AAV7W7C1_PLEWA|nr:hypothetical protein NDU88_004264 [Pleurodeles waltl]
MHRRDPAVRIGPPAKMRRRKVAYAQRSPRNRERTMDHAEDGEAATGGEVLARDTTKIDRPRTDLKQPQSNPGGCQLGWGSLPALPSNWVKQLEDLAPRQKEGNSRFRLSSIDFIWH